MLRTLFYGDVNFKLAVAVWMRNVTAYSQTWKINLLPNFFDPLFYLLGMGLGLGGYVSGNMGGGDYLSFIAPGLMAASAMNGASFEASYNIFVKMHFAKLYNAYLTTQISVGDIAMGELFWSITRGFIYGFAFYLILIGFTIAGYPILVSKYAVLVPFALVLIAAVFSAIGQLFTSWITKIDYFSFYWTLFLTPLFLFSDIFFPLDQFPYGHTIAWFTPLYHAVILCRALCRGELSITHLYSVLWMLLVVWVCFRLSLGQFQKKMIH